MPKFHISTNRGTYEIEANREPTQEEAQQYVDAQGAAPVAKAAEPGKYADDPEVDLETGAKGLFKAAFGGGTANDKAAYNTLRDADHSLGASATARYGLPLLSSMGGGVGAAAGAGGEEIAQMIESGKVRDPGAVTKAGIMGAIPLSKANGIIATLWNAAKMGAGSAAGTEASSLVNDGKLADTGDVVKDAAIGGAIPVGAAMVGKVAGKIMGNVAPEEAARVAKANADDAVKLKQAAKLINAGGALPPAELGDSSFKNWIAQQFAGKEHLQQQSSIGNEPVLRGMVRKDIGLAESGPLTGDSIEAAQTKAMKPYEAVANLSDNAANDFQRLKEARAELRDLNDAYKASDGKAPNLLDQIKAQRETVDGLESMMEAHAAAGTNPKLKSYIDAYYESKNAGPTYTDGSQPSYDPSVDQQKAAGLLRKIEGRAGANDVPPLIEQMRAGRKTYAKTMQLQDADAISHGRQQLDPQALARSYEVRNNTPNMSGGMEDAALIADAFPRETQLPSTIGTPGVSRLNGMAATQALASGSVAKGLTTATVPFLGPMIRDHLLSPENQRTILARALAGKSPNTSADPAIIAAIIRAMEQANIDRRQQQ